MKTSQKFSMKVHRIALLFTNEKTPRGEVISKSLGGLLTLYAHSASIADDSS